MRKNIINTIRREDPEGVGKGNRFILPGYRRAARFREEISSLATCRGVGGEAVTLIHAGGKIYLIKQGELPRAVFALPGKSRAMSCGGICLFTNGESLIALDGSGRVSRLSQNPEINACRTATVYKDRIILSDSPALPGRLFIISLSESGEIECHTLTEGLGRARIHTLISRDGYLWLFKSADEGDGAVICLEGDGLTPVRRISLDEGCISATATREGFALLTYGGLTLIERVGREDERIIRRPLPERFLAEGVRPIVWQDRIALYREGEMLLLGNTDSPTLDEGDILISGIGTYKGDRRLFRYLPRYTSRRDPMAHRPAVGEIYSYQTSSDRMVYFSKEGDASRSVYPTEERFGGELLPAEIIATDGSRLMFACGREMYLFTKDGIAAEAQKYSKKRNRPDAPTEEEIELYYFAGHKPSYKAVARSERKRNE